MKIIRLTDVKLLVKSRLDYFIIDGHMPDENRELVIANLQRYFEKHTLTDDFIALGVLEGEEIVSLGFMVIHEMPANGFAPSGKTGTLLNILTYPEHQKKGYGTALITAFREEAQKRKLDFLDLYATEQGRKLYENMGFTTVPYQGMRLKINNSF